MFYAKKEKLDLNIFQIRVLEGLEKVLNIASCKLQGSRLAAVPTALLLACQGGKQIFLVNLTVHYVWPDILQY